MNRQVLQILPHAVAIPLFVILASVFFSPAYDGYDLRQGDISQFLGMSKEIRDYRAFYEEETLWTNSMFSGMPAYQISLKQDRNVPKMTFTAIRTAFQGPIGTLFLAMLSFYILGLCMRINPWLSMIGAVAFGFSSVHILYLAAGHASKVNAIALMPGVLGGVLLAFRRSLWAGAAVTALWLSMHLAANHLQMTYYLLYLIGFVVIAEVIRLLLNAQAKKALLTSAVLLLAAVLALLPNMTNILTTYEYSDYTTRGKSELTVVPEGRENEEVNREGLDPSYILEYSMARGEFWSMLVPNIKGGATGAIGNDPDLMDGIDRGMQQNVAQSNQYWGEQRFTAGAFYFGALIMALFIISFFVLRDTLRWPFLLVTLLAIVLSWKDPSFITNIFLDSVPLFAKFRDTKMMLVLVSIVAPFMAIWLVDELRKGIPEERRKWLHAGSGFILVLLLLFTAAPGVLFDFVSAQERAQFENYIIDSNNDPQTVTLIDQLTESLETVRQRILRADALRSLIFAIIGVALLLLLDRKKLPASAAMAVFGVAALVDIYTVDQRYVNDEKQGREYVHWETHINKMFPHQVSAADQSIMNLEMQQQPAIGKTLKEAVDLRVSELDDKYTDDLTSREREAGLDRVRASARFGMLNLETHYRVLNLNNTFNDARTSYFHKSLGGYHGAKLGRYQELIDFHLGPELQRFMESARSIGAAAMSGLNISNMLNAQYLIIDPNSQALANPNAYGNAWFVKGIEFAETADDEIEALYTLNTATDAVVHREFESLVPVGLVPDSSATITLTNYEPNHLEYTASCTQEQLAVFSEIWYPEGWQAYIDGGAVDHVRTNYVLRALTIPPGEHKIEFVFAPDIYETGQTLSAAGSAVLMIFVIGGALLAWRRREKTATTV